MRGEDSSVVSSPPLDSSSFSLFPRDAALGFAQLGGDADDAPQGATSSSSSQSSDANPPEPTQLRGDVDDDASSDQEDSSSNGDDENDSEYQPSEHAEDDVNDLEPAGGGGSDEDMDIGDGVEDSVDHHYRVTVKTAKQAANKKASLKRKQLRAGEYEYFLFPYP
jgi:hypothetical protein